MNKLKSKLKYELKYKLICWWRLKFEKCEHCGLRLRKSYDSYYGAVAVPTTIDKSNAETFYVCNLCYYLINKLK